MGEKQHSTETERIISNAKQDGISREKTRRKMIIQRTRRYPIEILKMDQM